MDKINTKDSYLPRPASIKDKSIDNSRRLPFHVIEEVIFDNIVTRDLVTGKYHRTDIEEVKDKMTIVILC